MAKKSKWPNIKVRERPLDYYNQVIPVYKKATGKIRKVATSVTFTADDLSALGDYMVAGMCYFA